MRTDRRSAARGGVVDDDIRVDLAIRRVPREIRVTLDPEFTENRRALIFRVRNARGLEAIGLLDHSTAFDGYAARVAATSRYVKGHNESTSAILLAERLALEASDAPLQMAIREERVRRCRRELGEDVGPPPRGRLARISPCLIHGHYRWAARDDRTPLDDVRMLGHRHHDLVPRGLFEEALVERVLPDFRRQRVPDGQEAVVRAERVVPECVVHEVVDALGLVDDTEDQRAVRPGQVRDVLRDDALDPDALLADVVDVHPGRHECPPEQLPAEPVLVGQPHLRQLVAEEVIEDLIALRTRDDDEAALREHPPEGERRGDVALASTGRAAHRGATMLTHALDDLNLLRPQ